MGALNFAQSTLAQGAISRTDTAFERFFLRNKLYAQNRKTPYLKYIQYLRKINDLYYPFQPIDKWVSLIAKIDKEPILFGKSWLKQEIGLILEDVSEEEKQL